MDSHVDALRCSSTKSEPCSVQRERAWVAQQLDEGYQMSVVPRYIRILPLLPKVHHVCVVLDSRRTSFMCHLGCLVRAQVAQLCPKFLIRYFTRGVARRNFQTGVVGMGTRGSAARGPPLFSWGGTLNNRRTIPKAQEESRSVKPGFPEHCATTRVATAPQIPSGCPGPATQVSLTAVELYTS